LGSGLGTLALHEKGDLLVEIEFRPVYLKFHRVRNTLGEYFFATQVPSGLRSRK
jgi:hypothetical protein